MRRILRGALPPFVVVLAVVLLIAPGSESGGAQKLGSGPTGAIFTTMPDGGIVNENVRYPSKSYVYLDGGPPPNAPATAAGLDDGYYVFQITDPSGKLLLSEDPTRCRVMTVSGGVITGLVKPSDLAAVEVLLGFIPQDADRTDNWKDNGKGTPCHVDNPPTPFDPATPDDFGVSNHHDTNTDVDHGLDAGAITVQMMPFGTTPNPGGVYKAWITPLTVYLERGGLLDFVPKQARKPEQKPHECPDFCAVNDPGFGPPRSVQKTDNFKVLEQQPMVHIYKFEDMDGDGIRDPEDTDIEGWQITITETLFDGTTVDSVCFTPCWQVVAPGSTITVTEEVQDGWVQSHLSIDGAVVIPPTTSVDVTFAPGQMNSEVVFGNYKLASKSGVKFEDLDADGLAREAGEEGLAGWTIFVDYNGNGSPDEGEPSAVTGEGGAYTIDGIEPGTYSVTEVQQDDWTCSFPAGCAYDETFVSGDVKTGNDFGNWKAATKSGMKFEDLNADGIKQEGEPGLGGWTIYVDANGSGAFEAAEDWSAVTAEDGSYLIEDIVPGGPYTITEVQQADWTCSYPAGCAYSESFESREAKTGNDFGNWTTATKSGMKVQDVNHNGVYDAGTDVGLAGWTIYVDYDNDGSLDAGEPSTVSGEGGAYEITGIVPGSFNVREVIDDPNWACAFPEPCFFNHEFVSSGVFADNIFGNRPIEGCTPGYWKQPQHFDSWEVTPYSPSTVVGTVFTEAAVAPYEALGSQTFLDALNFQGGDEITEAAEILLRAAVASLLNDVHPDVLFDQYDGDVVAAVNVALASGDRATIIGLASVLDAANNKFCPLN